ncbi:hypothetical protein TSMEX_010888 [Taenia solium]|eukprot:TsM_001122100 transcript=TsM_001122100 gene=TsM_001122100
MQLLDIGFSPNGSCALGVLVDEGANLPDGVMVFVEEEKQEVGMCLLIAVGVVYMGADELPCRGLRRRSGAAFSTSCLFSSFWNDASPPSLLATFLTSLQVEEITCIPGSHEDMMT